MINGVNHDSQKYHWSEGSLVRNFCPENQNIFFMIVFSLTLPQTLTATLTLCKVRRLILSPLLTSEPSDYHDDPGISVIKLFVWQLKLFLH